MKKLYFICLLAFLGCGGGSDDLEASGDVTAFDSSDFQGTFDYQDDNCTYSLINQFTVTQSGVDLTLVITKTGLSGYTNGTSFDGSIKQDGATYYYADFDSELGCQATYVLDESEANSYTDASGVTFLAEDLLVVCEDDPSVGGFCVAAYEKK